MLKILPKKSLCDQALDATFGEGNDPPFELQERCERAFKAIPNCSPRMLCAASYGYLMYLWIDSLPEDKRAMAELKLGTFLNDPTIKWGDTELFHVADRYSDDWDTCGLVLPGDVQQSKTWIIENRIASPGSGLLVAPQDTGKTFWLLDLAHALADKRRTHWTNAPIIQHGGVLFFAAERHEDIPARLVPLGLDDGSLPFIWTKGCPCLLDKGELSEQAIEEILIKARRASDIFKRKYDVPLVAILIDTYSEAAQFKQGQESDSGVNQAIFRGFNRISRELDGAFVLASDHMGADGGRARGSTAKEGAADTVFHLTATQWRLFKIKGAGKGTKLPFTLKEVDGTCVVEVGSSQSPTGRLTKGAAFLQDIIDEVGKGQARAVFYERHKGKTQTAKQKAYKRAAIELGSFSE